MRQIVTDNPRLSVASVSIRGFYSSDYICFDLAKVLHQHNDDLPAIRRPGQSGQYHYVACQSLLTAAADCGPVDFAVLFFFLEGINLRISVEGSGI
jgi:hypothetical protein